jgi:hypothetical protein
MPLVIEPIAIQKTAHENIRVGIREPDVHDARHPRDFCGAYRKRRETSKEQTAAESIHSMPFY